MSDTKVRYYNQYTKICQTEKPPQCCKHQGGTQYTGKPDIKTYDKVIVSFSRCKIKLPGIFMPKNRRMIYMPRGKPIRNARV